MPLPLVSLLILALATWRLASLFANEAGPFNLFGWIRARIGVKTDTIGQVYGENLFAQGMVCVWCNSLWFGTLWTVVYYVLPTLASWMALPLALSTLTIVLQLSIDRLQYREDSQPRVQQVVDGPLSEADSQTLMARARPARLSPDDRGG
jgi:hypothetical protein